MNDIIGETLLMTSSLSIDAFVGGGALIISINIIQITLIKILVEKEKNTARTNEGKGRKNVAAASSIIIISND